MEAAEKRPVREAVGVPQAQRERATKVRPSDGPFLTLAASPTYILSTVDSAARPWPRADLRVSDADRRDVVVELQRHFIDGRLDSDELGERVAQSLAARTFGDLAERLVDLPVLPEAAPVELELPHANRLAGLLWLLVSLMFVLLMFAGPPHRAGVPIRTSADQAAIYRAGGFPGQHYRRYMPGLVQRQPPPTIGK